ncbi:MAG: cation:proton antiporter, partial [Clostridia bacterium]|nr:cation:proton antiporter [Clostridia bacterium]
MSSTLLSISIAMAVGLLLTRLKVIKKFNLPDVTAYLIAGVLIGPCILGKLTALLGVPGMGFQSYEELDGIGVISDVALGFIAFSIGNEFRLSQLRETGRQATIIGIVQAFVATAVTDIGLILVHFLRPDVLSLPAAITLGAIAAATAPAATLMVVRQYKAKGPVVDILLPIVALDDAVGLVLFAVSFGIAKALKTGSPDVFSILVDPLIEIGVSLALGAVAGYVLTKMEAMFRSNTNRLVMTISFVFLTVAISMLKFEAGPVKIGFSSLLVCMMLGSVFCNMCPLSGEIMKVADGWTGPILELFFVLSGAQLDLRVYSKYMAVI